MGLSYRRVIGLTGLAMLLFARHAAMAQDDAPYVETFDGDDPAIMLNGTIDYGPDGAWSARIEDGKLQLYNAEGGKAVRYYTLPSLAYPGTGRISRTDGADIEVDVHISGDGRSGAGIVAGFDPHRKDYLLFAVGPERQVYVVQRKDRTAHVLGVRTSQSVRKGGFNTLEVGSSPSGLAFSVNGTQVMTVGPAEIPGHGIGIGVFGRGTFEFDKVTVARPRQSAGRTPSQPQHPAHVTVPSVRAPTDGEEADRSPTTRFRTIPPDNKREVPAPVDGGRSVPQ